MCYVWPLALWQRVGDFRALSFTSPTNFPLCRFDMMKRAKEKENRYLLFMLNLSGGWDKYIKDILKVNWYWSKASTKAVNDLVWFEFLDFF